MPPALAVGVLAHACIPRPSQPCIWKLLEEEDMSVIFQCCLRNRNGDFMVGSLEIQPHQRKDEECLSAKGSVCMLVHYAIVMQSSQRQCQPQVDYNFMAKYLLPNSSSLTMICQQQTQHWFLNTTLLLLLKGSTTSSRTSIHGFYNACEDILKNVCTGTALISSFSVSLHHFYDSISLPLSYIVILVGFGVVKSWHFQWENGKNF